MDLTFTEEESAYRDSVRRFVNDVVAPLLATKYDFSRALTQDEIFAFRADVAAHEVAVSPPVRADGSLDKICFSIFIEEIARINVGLASLAGALFFPVWDMIDLLDERQREIYGHWFEPGVLVAMGLSEPNTGSNLKQMETAARRTDDGWLINGRKLWISNAQMTPGIMVAARKIASDGTSDGSFGLFMVDRKQADYEVRPVPTLGMRAISICEVVFDDCRIAAEDEVLPERNGLRSALHLVGQARTKVAFMSVGIAQAALDLAVRYAKDRTQFGKPIGAHQLIQGLLAEMATEVEAARLMGFRAVSVSGDEKAARVAASMPKSYNTEMAARVTSKCIQVLGAMGLTEETPAERYFRDARMLTIPDGTTQIHQLVIGRELTGLNAFA